MYLERCDSVLKGYLPNTAVAFSHILNKAHAMCANLDGLEKMKCLQNLMFSNDNHYKKFDRLCDVGALTCLSSRKRNFVNLLSIDWLKVYNLIRV